MLRAYRTVSRESELDDSKSNFKGFTPATRRRPPDFVPATRRLQIFAWPRTHSGTRSNSSALVRKI